MSFAQYLPTSADEVLMENLEQTIGAIMSTDPQRWVDIGNKIVKILPALHPHSRAYYVLDGLYDIIADILELRSLAEQASLLPWTPVPEASDELLPDLVVDLTGNDNSFSLDEITVNQWDVVQINFSSTAWYHDWVIDGLISTPKVRPEDGVVSVVFAADIVWTYEYYCSIGQHRSLWMSWEFIIQ
jgi:plastocyanin